jgi:crotonobetainyl-CoA:carnitine CoA-transferase CaiB-like acyl-CoA transferase
VRVLDLTTVVAGPTTTMILADLGADVIKVERIDGGDDARGMPPHRGPWGSYFVPVNRGKRSISLDLRKPDAREVVLKIAERCDVCVENFRGGKAKELGLDEPAIRSHKPDIIYASLSAYGQLGPDSNKPGYDAILQARSGIMSVTGVDDTPMRAGVSILDVGAGVWMALGIVTSLYERQLSGRGQRVDASLLQTGVMLMCYHLLYRQVTGLNPGPEGARHSSVAPYGAFATSDGTIMIGISNDRVFRRLCKALDRTDWLDELCYSSNAERCRNRAGLEGQIEDLLRTKPTAHWVEIFNEHDVPNDAVQTADQVLHDPQIAALNGFAEIPLCGEEPALIPRLPITLSRTAATPAGPPPALGEHSRIILREAGYADTEIDELIRAGACRAEA